MIGNTQGLCETSYRNYILLTGFKSCQHESPVQEKPHVSLGGLNKFTATEEKRDFNFTIFNRI